MQWIPCIKIPCSGVNAALRNGSRVNAVDFMQMVQWIPIEFSGIHEAGLNAVDSVQSGAMYLDYWNVFDAV